MQWLEMDVQAMKNGFVYVNPAHITSNNLNGTDSNLDRYWYFYAQQNGAAFADVYQYFRFNTDGVIGTRPIQIEYAGNCTVDCTTIRLDSGPRLESKWVRISMRPCECGHAGPHYT